MKGQGGRNKRLLSRLPLFVLAIVRRRLPGGLLLILDLRDIMWGTRHGRAHSAPKIWDLQLFSEMTL